MEWFNTFKEKSEVVYSIPLFHTTLEEQELIFRSIVDRFNGKRYDFGAFCYFGWRVLLKKWFNIGFPVVNKWDSSGKFLCTEIAGGLPEPFRVSENTSITTPFKLWEIYKEKLGKYYPISQ